MTMGQRIESKLKQTGMTKQQLAKAAGLSLQTVIAATNDSKHARISTIRLMAEVLNVTPLWLLNGEGETAEEQIAYHLSEIQRLTIEANK